MKPNRKLAEATAPEGGHLTLNEHDGSYCIRLNGQPLMHSSTAESELLLGKLAVGQLTGESHSRVLIGGLGLGFSLKSVLAQVGSDVTVHVAELIPEIVSWNRTFLGGLNGPLLDDARVKVFVEDVSSVIARAGRDPYDALVLDIDNGPTAMVQKPNGQLYAPAGIRTMWAALKPGGRAAIWSASSDYAFATRLAVIGFSVEAIPAKLYANAKRFTSTIYTADKPMPARC